MNYSVIDTHPVGLTVTEISNIWSSYFKSSSDLRFFEYFLATTEDTNIKQVIKKMLAQSQKNISQLEDIFSKESLNVPIAFTEEDINVGAQKVFSDTFILHFCHDIALLSLNTYPSALSDCTRKDIRDHFQMNLEFSVKIQNEIIDLMLAQGVYLRPPQIAISDELDFVDTRKYLSGLFGGSRPLNLAEIANLSRIIHRAQFSKMIFVAFSKLAKLKEMKQHFSNGRDEIEKVLDSLQEVLEKENIPISASGDYKIFDVEESLFSDKLMLFFVNTCLGIFCFIMISQAMTSSLRSDIVSKVTKISNDMKKYYADGLTLSIKENWLEQPPQALDRKV